MSARRTKEERAAAAEARAKRARAEAEAAKDDDTRRVLRAYDLILGVPGTEPAVNTLRQVLEKMGAPLP